MYSKLFIENLLTLPQALVDEGYMVFPEVFTPAVIAELAQQYAIKSHALRPAMIGKGDEKLLSPNIRGDHMLWLESQDICFQPFFDLLDQITQLLRQELFLPIRSREAQMAFYRQGQFYARHKDRHSHSSQRLVSLVLYLNPWQAGDGGELVLYPTDSPAQFVTPLFNNMVIFLSELDHEVRPTLIERKSLTAWLREDI